MATNGVPNNSTSKAALEGLLAATARPAFQRGGRGREQVPPDPLEAPVESPHGRLPVTDKKAPVPQASAPQASVYHTTTADSRCVGELVFPPDTNPTDLVRIWKGLEENLKAEMLSMDHSSTGTTVKCAVADMAPLLGWLATAGKVMSWSFTTPWERARIT